MAGAPRAVSCRLPSTCAELQCCDEAAVAGPWQVENTEQGAADRVRGRALLGSPRPVSRGSGRARSEALALFAAKPYAGAPLTDLAAHLTNTCAARRGAGRERGGRAQSSSSDEDDGAAAAQPECGGCGGASSEDCGTSPDGRARRARSSSACSSGASQDGAAAVAGDARGGCSGAGGAATNGHDKRGAGADPDRGGGLSRGGAAGAALGGRAGQEGGDAGPGAAQREAGREGAWREEDAVRLVSELPQVPASGPACATLAQLPCGMAARPADAARLCSSAGRGPLPRNLERPE
jgi:hypothetical protein